MIELLGVPFDGYGRPGHQARAAAALREAGLVERLGARDLGDLDLPPGSPERGPTSLVNDAALVEQTSQLASRLRAVLDAGGFPVRGRRRLHDAARHGARGAGRLLFVDGHEDTMPLDVSEDGEAANAELGLLLGLTGRTLTRPAGRLTSAARPRPRWRCSGRGTPSGGGRSTSGRCATSATGSATPPRPPPTPRAAAARPAEHLLGRRSPGGCTWTSTSWTRCTSPPRACPATPARRAG